ncbi:methylated-DNA--[protein]-cysteine S-methyltransferase [Arenimonas fontis]|uniref:methylated-DNA--[protein]-cysteine S-methyltransferase n=1 Tax=Arenimonas fontis TaxID=2608255 RepID=A0A5B2Z7U3_9GAMM|nr:methylated-DNA--[protein]-cysteine S-methyltransferase [Arenimonas fontis]KAA2283945.1 methylated-DNA--[protein]-cysteine S-methyltransferase [Arenimonas fontis]
MENTPDPRLERARCLLDRDDMDLAGLGRAVGLSPSHLQRRFRAQYGLSPAEYRAQRRLQAFKRELRAGSEVTRAVYEAGYGSPSRVYEDGAARLGMAPLAYRRGGEGMEIRWSLVDTALGLALVAVTERGVCAVLLGDSEGELAARLQAEFPRARLQRVDAGRDEFLAPRVRAVAQALAQRRASVPVELVGTAFQQRVWQALMRIPPGQTRSYAEIAAELGQPRAVRAVARACAGNRVAVLVPCHRVIRSDGSLGGYRWGLPRKRELLAREAGREPTREGAARHA